MKVELRKLWYWVECWRLLFAIWRGGACLRGTLRLWPRLRRYSSLQEAWDNWPHWMDMTTYIYKHLDLSTAQVRLVCSAITTSSVSTDSVRKVFPTMPLPWQKSYNVVLFGKHKTIRPEGFEYVIKNP